MVSDAGQYIAGNVPGVYSISAFNTNIIQESVIVIQGEVSTGIDDLEKMDAYNVRVYPNPFSSSINIAFDLEENLEISLELFDLFGKKLSVISTTYFNSGEGILKWNGSVDQRPLPRGIYFYRMYIGKKSVSGKIMKL